MKRIMIIGCPGSGKTTLANELGKKTGLPVHHLDLLMWLPNWTARPYKEFLDAQDRVLGQETWIVDGNFTKSIPKRMERADTIIFFDMPRVVCLYRLMKRYIKYFGRNRPDMGGGNREALKFAQLKFVLTYPRKKVYEFLKTATPEHRIFIIRNQKDQTQCLSELTQ